MAAMICESAVCSSGAICFSEIKGSELKIPEVFMEKIFSRMERKVVIKEIRNGICVEAINREAIEALLKSIEKLKKE